MMEIEEKKRNHDNILTWKVEIDMLSNIIMTVEIIWGEKKCHFMS